MARLFPTEEKCICFFMQGGLERTGGEQLKPERPRAERERERKRKLFSQKKAFSTPAHPPGKVLWKVLWQQGEGCKDRTPFHPSRGVVRPGKTPKRSQPRILLLRPREKERTAESGGGGGEVAAARESEAAKEDPPLPSLWQTDRAERPSQSRGQAHPGSNLPSCIARPTPSWPPPPPPPPRRATVAPRRPRWTRQSWRPQRWTSATSSTRTRYRGEAHIY